MAGKVVAITGITDDTGASATDFYTNDQTLTLRGTSDAPAGTSVGIYLAGQLVDVVTVAADGTWSYDYSQGNARLLAEGEHVFEAKLLDKAGNVVGPKDAQLVTVDISGTTNPPGELESLVGKLVAITGITDDTGASATDFYTNDQTLTLRGTSDAPAGTSVGIYLAGVLVDVVAVAADGTWSYDYSQGNARLLPEGAHTFDAKLLDKAGNVVGSKDTQLVTVDISGDTTQPDGEKDPLAGKVVAITGISDDTGASATDFITNDQTLTLRGTSDAPAGTSVGIYLAGQLVDVVTVAADGTWSYDYSQGGARPLVDGQHAFDAKLLDLAGNVVGPMDSQVVKVLTIVQPSNIVAITGITDDTGMSASDFVTNDTTLTLRGTTDAPAGTVVAIYLAGVKVGEAVVDAAKNWSFDYSQGGARPLADGQHSFEVKLLDAAGNVTNVTHTQVVTVDTSDIVDYPPLTNPPTVVTITGITDDSGASATDFITNDNTLTLRGTTDAPAGTVVAIYLAGAKVGEATVDTTGNWSYDYSLGGARPLADGQHSFEAKLLDKAGNVTPVVDDQVVTVDTSPNVDYPPLTTPPTVVTISGITDDTGASTTDFITNDQTLTLRGTSDAPAGTVVAIYLAGAKAGEATVDSTGNWSYDYSLGGARPLADGQHTFEVKLLDTAGNVTPVVDDQVVTVDTNPDVDYPPIAVPPTVVTITGITDDTGVSATDFITSDNTLILRGTTDAPAGAVVAIYLAGAQVGQAVVDATGNWSFDYSQGGARLLPDGQHNFEAKLLDTAGNATNVTDAQMVMVNTSTPPSPNIVVITSITDDTGMTTSDFITNDKTLSIGGVTDAPAGTVVAIYLAGVKVGEATTDATSNWSFDYSLGGTRLLADGQHAFEARLLDATGNETSAVDSQIVTVDTDATTTDVVAITAITDDTGVLATDFVTKDTSLVFSGTSSASNGTQVAVFVDGVQVGVATVTNSTWTFDHTKASLSEGPHLVGAQLLDVAGNLLNTPTTQTVVIDTIGGLTTDLIAITAISDDSGALATDFVTNDTSLVFSGTSTAANGTQVAVFVDGIQVGVATVTNGTWSFDHTRTSLLDGTYQVSAQLLDVAGNPLTPAASKAVVVDTIGETQPYVVAITGISEDTGASASDFITYDQTLTLRGTSDAPAGSVLAIYLAGAKVGEVSVDATGNWSYDYSQGGTRPLLAGQHDFEVKLLDIAGNVTNVTDAQAVTVSTIPVISSTVTITGISDDTGASTTDFITKDPTLTLRGTSDAPAGTVAAIYLAGAKVSEVSVDATGNWSYDYSQGGTRPLADGQHTFEVRLVDIAGNETMVRDIQNVTVDTDVTTTDVVAITAISDDLGALATDFVTSDASLVFRGTSSAANGTQVAVFVNGIQVDTTTVNNGTWSYDYTRVSLPDGNHQVGVQLLDVAGNLLNAPVTQVVVVDTVSPPAYPLTFTSISEDTGVSDTDYITKDTTLEFRGTSTAADGTLLAVFIDGVRAGTAIVNSGTWTFDYSSHPLADGVYKVDVQQLDASGKLIGALVTQSVTIDTTGEATLDTVAITSISDDTGTSLVDFATKDNTLVFNGTSTAANGTQVAVFVDGIQVDMTTVNNGTWSYDHSAVILADGSHQIGVQLLDVAGNLLGTLVTQSVFVDTVASTLAVSILNAEDNFAIPATVSTGGASDDNSPLLQGTLSAALQPGDALKIYDNNNTFLGYATINGTSWSFQTQSLATGAHYFIARVADSFGNEGVASAPFVFTVERGSQVSTNVTDNSINSSVAGLADGGWIVTWAVNPNMGTGLGDIYQQRYNADGSPRGVPTQANISTAGVQDDPSVTALTDGGWIVTWTSIQSDGAVCLQSYNADGTPRGAEIVIDKLGDQVDSQVVGLTDGKFVVVWRDNSPGSYEIEQQVFNSNGTPYTPVVRVNTTNISSQVFSTVTELTDGGWVVTWSSDANGTPNDYEIYQQRYNADGSLRGAEVLVNSTTAEPQYLSDVAGLIDGGWVVTWQGTEIDGTLNVYQQRYSADGVTRGLETLVNSTTLANQSLPQVVGLADGGWVTTWAGISNGSNDVYLQRYNENGTTYGGEVLVNLGTLNAQGRPEISDLSDGGWIVSWQGNNPGDGSSDIYQQRFNALGEKVDSHLTMGAMDNVGAVQGPLAYGATTDDNQLDLSGELSGLLLNGQKVLVFDGNTLLGEATVTDASWTFATGTLSEGIHNLSVKLKDSSGTTVMTSEDFRINVDAVL
ncbi:Ig-like domain-containing protein [Aeromonas sanarellii]|uniref:Ig-like domain-containing protein n=1 Tax=Aeromonas sanarellii TaxID=633415 RepID=UPI003BA38C3D